MYEQIIEQLTQNNDAIFNQKSIDGFLKSRFNHMQLDDITYSDRGNIVIRKNHANIDSLIIEFIDEEQCEARVIDMV